jgi:hypothetical protein
MDIDGDLIFVGRGLFILMTPFCLIPRFKLDLKNIVNCDAIKSSLVLIYSCGENWGLHERRSLRIRVNFPEGSDDQVRIVTKVLKREL